MLQLYFTRAKIFYLPGDDDTGERRFTAGLSGGKPIPAPDWVCETLTYKVGIKDKSIVDLTPPKRGRKADPEPEAEPEVTETAEEEDDEVEVAAATASAGKSAKAAKDAGKAVGLKSGR